MGTEPIVLDEILSQSRRNNVRSGVTGLLYFGGNRFLQVLEGPIDAVEATFARIKGDPRHRGMVVLSRRTVAEREFGLWDMASSTTEPIDQDSVTAQLNRLTADADVNVLAQFDSFARLRKTG